MPLGVHKTALMGAAGAGGVESDVVAYGGMINQYLDAASVNTYRTHTFRGKGGWLEVISNPLNRTADILIVAGGGNAIGDYYNNGSGGGGAGGVRLITGETMTTGVKTMSVGRGGVRYSASYAGNNGSDTWFTGWTAPYPTADGGGAGQTNNGQNGGSGGGGSANGSGGSGNANSVSPAEGMMVATGSIIIQRAPEAVVADSVLLVPTVQAQAVEQAVPEVGL